MIIEDDVNKMIGSDKLKGYVISLIYPLDESLQANYKIVSPDDLSYLDFVDASKRLNIDNEVYEKVEVVTDSGIAVIFELSGTEILANNKRYIIEWYEGEFEEDECSGVLEKKVGKVHREAFRTKESLRERYFELNAISSNYRIVDAMYECDIKEISINDTYYEGE